MNDTQLILKLYKNGIGIKKISAILELSLLEIYQCLDDANINYRDSKYKERDNNACKMYSDGMNISDIARELKINRHTVTDILKNNNVYKGNVKASNNDDSKKERNEKIISLYKNGMSGRAVAEEIGICVGTVFKVLKYFNEDARPAHQKGHSKGTSKNRKYFFDLDFFERIDNEEKAYWLGFLYADGYVAYKGYVELGLQEQDVKHIEKFRNALKANEVPIRYKESCKAYSISLGSVKLSTDLVKLGCPQKKSLILKFPSKEQVPEEFINHFMRGYFEGDGCIHVPEVTRNSVLSVLGTKDFLDDYERYLLKAIEKDSPNKRIHRKTWDDNTECISYGGRAQILKIFQFLYKDSTIYLDRKFNKFKSLLPSNPEMD